MHLSPLLPRGLQDLPKSTAQLQNSSCSPSRQAFLYCFVNSTSNTMFSDITRPNTAFNIFLPLEFYELFLSIKVLIKYTFCQCDMRHATSGQHYLFFTRFDIAQLYIYSFVKYIFYYNDSSSIPFVNATCDMRHRANTTFFLPDSTSSNYTFTEPIIKYTYNKVPRLSVVTQHIFSHFCSFVSFAPPPPPFNYGPESRKISQAGGSKLSKFAVIRMAPIGRITHPRSDIFITDTSLRKPL